MNIHAAVCFIYFAVLSITSFDDSYLCSGSVIDSRQQIYSDRNEITIGRSKRAAITDYKLKTECKEDIERLCSASRVRSDDVLSVLECFENSKGAEITQKCQNELWRQTTNLQNDTYLKSLGDTSCSNDWDTIKSYCEKHHTDAKPYLLTCMIDSGNNGNNGVSVQCWQFIQRIEVVAFSDFRLVSQFTDKCNEDVARFSCGRMPGDKFIMSQAHTLTCLQQYVDRLGDACKAQVLHLSSIQAENVRFDRQLFLACTDERMRFCPNVGVGTGQVFRCLMQHKFDTSMSEQCEQQLSRHQKLITQDYSVSKGLARACKEDIRTYRCRRLVSEDKGIRLAQILLCLENVMKNGSKIARDCQVEMIEHRKILMEDYRLSPEIVSHCSNDITSYCSGLEIGGKTIHCLMEHSLPGRKRSRVSPPCLRALETLIKETDAGEDWRVDPVLREACKPVVDVACQDTRGGDARVISCLMEKLGTTSMTEACESALLQIQYFVARDYKLDPMLYRACHYDAVKVCHAKRAWHDEETMDPERGPLVLPCLFRYVYQSQDKYKLRRECVDEVRRVMRQRALNVDLHPEVEDACLDDLALYCFEKTNKGEEMVCLQDHLEQLKPHCKEIVSNFTEVQAENLELNPVLMSMCKSVMEKHCESELRNGNGGDVMECLIEHKNEPDVRSDYKCRATIEHQQIISLKDYHFTVKFKEACRIHVARFCPSAHTKAEVVECLSTIIRNDTLRDARHSIPKDCRQQLKAQLLQQRENIDLDPNLKKACSDDVQKYCNKVQHGSAQVLECLEANKKGLSDGCHRYIFNVERQDLTDSSTDYTLLTTCRLMIKQFCHKADLSDALSCLKVFKDDSTFDPKCKLVVIRRMIEQSNDYRFNPALTRGCQPDISKFCADVIAKHPEDSELEGKVIKCLKVKFRERKLRNDCEQQLTTVLREAALNYQLNPLLRSFCESEIKELCGNTEDGSGAVEECLKVALLNGQITNRVCRLEVAGLIEEAKADIHVDPLLHQACTADISRFCADVPQGAGRLIQCLLGTLDGPKGEYLHPECRTKLQQRVEMFRNAEIVKKSPQNIGELVVQVNRSPGRRYFMLVGLTIVGMVFIIGMFCGRVTRRTMIMKNK